MSLRRLSNQQPDNFDFTAEHKVRAEAIIAKYPKGYQASAVIPLLDLAQRQEGWVVKPAIECIAAMLDMDVIRVLEVATFYTMFNLSPVGKCHIQVCTNLPCMLRGSSEVVSACENKLGVKLGGTTEDGEFTLNEVECAGACVNAPIVAINDDYYEDLDYESMGKLIDAIKSGHPPVRGSILGRQGVAPAGVQTSLTADPTQKYPKQDLAAAMQKFQEAQEAAHNAKEGA